MTQILTHDEVYHQINNGDIMFVANSKNIVSEIIRLATRSEYSHCAILFWVDAPGGTKRLMVAEAQVGTTLRIQDFDFYRSYSLNIIAAPKDFLSYETALLTRVGQVKYDYFEALYVGIRDLFSRYLNITLPTYNFRGEICSEFVARMLGLPSADISPQDLFLELNEPIKFSVSTK